jgi:hypothetical protein
MLNLLIGFRTFKAKKSIESKIMLWGLNHDTIHCELFFCDYEPTPRFSSWNGSGVGFRPISEQQMGDISEWTFYDLGSERYYHALYIAQNLQGRGYDLKTAIMSSMGLISNNEEAYFCSEICFSVLYDSGVPLLPVKASIVLPHELEIMLQSQFPKVELTDYIR